ncbi:hypothetical protein PV327_004101 [Microctonus hyperodae]|uniref:Uncharacterized protein n=1 Tax=Microctonus hyperodae TaxID=165561 RepID=A0AA39FBP6_MICHY|nr:hypothetical protein PV327_004101 [Microctonus hyperodae]
MLERVSKELEEIKIRIHINSTPKNNTKEKKSRDHDPIQPPLDLPGTWQRQQQQGSQQEEHGKLDAEDFIRKVDNKFLAENIHKNVALGIVREMLTGHVEWFENSRRKWRDRDQFKEIFQDTFSIYQDDTDRQLAIYEQTRRQNETYVQLLYEYN